MDKLEERITLQDKKLVRLETLMEGVADDMKKVSTAMETQTKLMAKLSSLEEYTKESINRLHKRLDKTEGEIDEIKEVPAKIVMRAILVAVSLAVAFLFVSVGLK